MGELIYVLRIQEGLNIIRGYLGKYNYSDFMANRMLSDSCVLQLARIGESVGKLSKELKLRYSQIDWGSLHGMRCVIEDILRS